MSHIILSTSGLTNRSLEHHPPRSAHSAPVPQHHTPYAMPLTLPPLSPWSPHPLYPQTAPPFASSPLPHYPPPVLVSPSTAPLLIPPSIATMPAGYARNPSISSPYTDHQSFSHSPLRTSLSERQKSDEAAYFAKRDTKERPPSHVIERERRAIDWKSLRYTDPPRDVIEELLKMSTKNLKGPEDVPKRPMNGELARHWTQVRSLIAAFMIYMSTRRPQIARTNPKNVNGENSKILAREWSWYMPEIEKQYWLDLAEDYREEFKRRFPSYQYRKHGVVSPDGGTPAPSASKKRRSSDPTSGAGDHAGRQILVQDEESGRRARPTAWRAMTNADAVGPRWEETRAPGQVPRMLHGYPQENSPGHWLQPHGHGHIQHQKGYEHPHSR